MQTLATEAKDANDFTTRHAVCRTACLSVEVVVAMKSGTPVSLWKWLWPRVPAMKSGRPVSLWKWFWPRVPAMKSGTPVSVWKWLWPRDPAMKSGTPVSLWKWLWPRVPAMKSGTPGFDSRFLLGDFPWSSHTSDLKVGTPVASAASLA